MDTKKYGDVVKLAPNGDVLVGRRVITTGSWAGHAAWYFSDYTFDTLFEAAYQLGRESMLANQPEGVKG